MAETREDPEVTTQHTRTSTDSGVIDHEGNEVDVEKEKADREAAEKAAAAEQQAAVQQAPSAPPAPPGEGQQGHQGGVPF